MSDQLPQSSWVPIYWPVIWKDPKSLDWITGTTINCVVFDGHSVDSAPLFEEAQRRGLAIVDWTRPEASGIVAGKAAQIPWTGPHPIAAITDAVWPGIRKSSARDKDAVDTGPTGAPWIEANGWLVQLARARAPEKTIWLISSPPRNQPRSVIAVEAYLLAIADAAAGKARWVLTLDELLAQELAFRRPAAIGRWQRILATLRFFEQRRALAGGHSRAAVAVISTFSGNNELLGTELLNLAARRNLLHSVLLTSQVPSADFKTLKAIIWLDNDAPEEMVRLKLESFVQRGGLLIAPAWAEKMSAGGQPVNSPVPGYELRQVGHGRVARPVAAWEDPYLIAADAHVLISHREDPVTLFNGGSLLAWDVDAPGGELVQLVRYSAQSASLPVSIQLRRTYSSVRVATLENPNGEDITWSRLKSGVELPLPSFGVFAALDLRT